MNHAHAKAEKNQGNERRRRRRFVVAPRYQIQFALLLVIFQFNVGIVYQGIMQIQVRAAAERAGSLHNFMVMNLWSEVLPWMLAVSATVSVLVYLMGLYFSNSIVGPIPRIRRALRQISEGDYSPHLMFRPGDALEDLAQDVNHLASALQKRVEVENVSAGARRNPEHQRDVAVESATV